MDSNQADKISKLLSDPESLMTIASLAKNFLSAQTPQSTFAQPAKEQQQYETVIQEPEASSQIAGPIQVPVQAQPSPPPSQFDERANLLRSIKPYLKAERQPKVDSLVKAINIAKIINTYTGNDLFK